MAGYGAGLLILYVATITPIGASIATVSFVIAALLGAFLRTGSGWDLVYWVLTVLVISPSLIFISQVAGAPPGAGIDYYDLGLGFLVFFFFGPFASGWVIGCVAALAVRLARSLARGPAMP
jgi:hypothetical protein